MGLPRETVKHHSAQIRGYEKGENLVAKVLLEQKGPIILLLSVGYTLGGVGNSKTFSEIEIDFIMLHALKGVIVSSIKNTQNKKQVKSWMKTLMEHKDFVEQLGKYGVKPEDFQVPIYTCICSLSSHIDKSDLNEDCNLIINKEDLVLNSFEHWWLKNIIEGLPSITDFKQLDALDQLAAKLAAFNSNPFQDNEWQKGLESSSLHLWPESKSFVVIKNHLRHH